MMGCTNSLNNVGPKWDGCPVFSGRVSTFCWFSVDPLFSALSRHCPDIGSILVFAEFTLLCNNVTFWLSRSALCPPYKHISRNDI